MTRRRKINHVVIEVAAVYQAAVERRSHQALRSHQVEGGRAHTSVALGGLGSCQRTCRRGGAS